jgi:hypothetical protein
MDHLPEPPLCPFRIEIAQARLEAIRERVRTFRWDAWSEPADAVDWKYGPPAVFMRDLCNYWTREYDWRRQEEAINRRSHFMMRIDDLDIHFTHERGSGTSPVPLLIAHGWPYSFHSYDGLIDPLAHPELHGGKSGEAFSVVIPSYPGYDFSSRPRQPMGPREIAFVFDKLMAKLGYERYMVHGGDWGAHITSLLAFHLPKRILGIHSTALALREAGSRAALGGRSREAPRRNREPLWTQNMRSGSGKGHILSCTQPGRPSWVSR